MKTLLAMWSRSQHTTTLVALVSLIGFSLIGSHTGSATVSPADPSPKQLIQAWVFDGVYQPSDVFGVALTDLGMLAHIENAFACPGGSSGTTTGFVHISAAQQGIFTMTPALPLGFGPDLDPTILLPPPPNPIDPNLVTSDCVALQHEAAVASYINNRQAEIATLNAQLSTCEQDVKAVVCQTLKKLQSVNEVCDENPDRCPSAQAIQADLVTVDNSAKDGNGEDLEDYLGQCSRCQRGLLLLPLLVDSAQKSIARCDEAKNSVQAELILLETFLGGSDPLQTPRLQVKAVANQAIDVAATARQNMNELLDDFAVAAVPCRHDELVASCNECSGQSPSEPPPLIPTGTVRVEQSTRNLGRLAAAFRAASDQTTDSNLRVRYAAVSERLRRLSNAQVLNVTAPSNEPFTQSFIALRRVDAPDDGRSPIAVVLTLVGSRRPCPPELNLADRQLLDQALQSFKDTLAPGRVCPTCTPR